MKRSRPTMRALTLLLVIGLLSGLSAQAVAASATLFSGRATAVSGTVLGTPVGPLADTGEVSPGGDSLHASLHGGTRRGRQSERL